MITIQFFNDIVPNPFQSRILYKLSIKLDLPLSLFLLSAIVICFTLLPFKSIFTFLTSSRCHGASNGRSCCTSISFRIFSWSTRRHSCKVFSLSKLSARYFILVPETTLLLVEAGTEMGHRELLSRWVAISFLSFSSRLLCYVEKMSSVVEVHKLYILWHVQCNWLVNSRSQTWCEAWKIVRIVGKFQGLSETALSSYKLNHVFELENQNVILLLQCTARG